MAGLSIQHEQSSLWQRLFSAVCQTTASTKGLSCQPHLRSEAWRKGPRLRNAAQIEHEFNRGEVPERSIGAVLKTAGCKPRGFESHPLRQVFRV